MNTLSCGEIRLEGYHSCHVAGVRDDDRWWSFLTFCVARIPHEDARSWTAGPLLCPPKQARSCALDRDDELAASYEIVRKDERCDDEGQESR